MSQTPLTREKGTGSMTMRVSVSLLKIEVKQQEDDEQGHGDGYGQLGLGARHVFALPAQDNAQRDKRGWIRKIIDVLVSIGTTGRGSRGTPSRRLKARFDLERTG
jgi:hypothetical protein